MLPRDLHRVLVRTEGTNTEMARQSTRIAAIESSFTIVAAVAASVAIIVAAGLSGENVRVAAQTGGICDRTPQVVEGILGLLPGVTDCAAVTDTDLASLTGRLQLRSSQISELKAGDFAGLTNLTRLDLRRNQIAQLPDGVFDPLVSLTSLDIWQNRLTELPDGIFDELTQLLWLSIHNNRLTDLPVGVFSNNTALRFIIAHNNYLMFLRDDTFEGLSALSELTLGGNRLTELPSGIFDDSPVLESLELSKNKLRTLPAGIFSSNTQLLFVRLDGNQLSSLPDDVFDGLSVLVGLHLQNNDLTRLPTGFVATPSQRLRDLYIGENSIASLPPGFLAKLNAAIMLRLDLSGIALSEADIDAIATFTFLTDLHLSNTGIGDGLILKFLQNVERPDTILILDLSLNGLGTWYGNAVQTDVDAFHAGIEKLTSIFYLYFGDPTLDPEDLKAILESMPTARLTQLFLDGGNLAGFDWSVLSRLTSLTHVFASDAGITDDDFTNLAQVGPTRLIYLALTSNEITDIPSDGLGRFPNLQSLHLSDNSIEEIEPDDFDGLTQLLYLFLNLNQLTELEQGLFGSAPNLYQLDLSWNDFNQIDPMWFAGMTNLAILNLESNPLLEELNEEDFFSILPALAVLDLEAFVPPEVKGPTDEEEPPLLLVQPRIYRIEPQIANIRLRVGDSVRLAVDIYGRQDILDNDLASRIDTLVWAVNDDGGDISVETPNSVVYTAPQQAGKHIVTANVPYSNGCLWRQDDDDEADALARCTAEFEIVVLRRSTISIDRPEPVNPPGNIPDILADDMGNQYEVFTPVEGGAFVGDGFSLSASAGAVPNGEILGVRMSVEGAASNAGMTQHRYILGGVWYGVGIIDGTGSPISSYLLNQSARACIPLPDGFRGNVSDVVMVAAKDEDLSVRSVGISLRSDGEAQICGGLSELPTRIAAAKLGSPSPLIELAPEIEPLHPDTGGFAPPGLALFLILIIGAFGVASSSYVALKGKRTPSCSGARSVE